MRLPGIDRPRSTPADNPEPLAGAPDKRAGDLDALTDQFRRAVKDLAAAGPKAEVKAQLERLSSGAPVARRDLGREAQVALRAALPDDVSRVLAREVHPGVDNPFDFAKLAGALPASAGRALSTYLQPGFPYAAPAHKAEVLAALEPLLTTEGAAEARRVHLPQTLGGRPGAAILTYALEAEVLFTKRPRLLDVYAPDRSGKLDPQVTRGLLARIAEDSSMLSVEGDQIVGGQAWLRSSEADRAASLSWRALSPQGRTYYLMAAREAGGRYPPLYRITEPKHAPRGEVFPDTLQDKVSWEGHAAELITDSYYSSLDTLHADLARIEGLRHEGERPNGYHVHMVSRLPTPEDRVESGVAMVNLIALEDLELFCYGAAAATGLEHDNQVPWRADDIQSVVEHFAEGELDPDFFAEHKFHQVGLRGGIYGAEDALGAENRGVLIGDVDFLKYNVDRHSRILAGPGLTQLPRDLFDGWRAGDPALVREAFDRATAKDPELKALAADSRLSFDDLFSAAMDSVKQDDPFVLASPLWNFEDLLPLAPHEAERVAEARAQYEHSLETLYLNMTRGLQDEHAELDDEQLGQDLRVAVCKFFEASGIDRVIARYLDRFAYEQG